MRKFVALLLALVCICTLFTACGGPSNSNNPDNSDNSGNSGGTTGQYNTAVGKDDKMVISFHNYGGGTGVKWIELAAETFAKNNADRVFENGKKGVYIEIDDVQGYNVSNLASSTFDVLVGDARSFLYASKDLLLELDEVVKDDTREGGSIEDNLIEQAKESSKYNGKYYSIPFFEYYPGLSYNHEVFEKRGYFIAEGDNGTAFTSKYSATPVRFTNDVTKKSVGADGVAGTEDDGLPVSLEQFIVLMDKIKKDGQYAPVVLSGRYLNYSQYFAAGLMSALAGKEQMANFYNASGEVEIVCREASGNSVELTDENLFPGIDYIKKPKTKKVTLTAENGYLGSDLAARYYANAIFEIMEKEGFWSQDVQDENRDHLGAQLAFLTGKKNAARQNAAMLVESSYWMNEARDNNLGPKVKQALGKNIEEVDVRFMSLPTCFYTADAEVGASSVVNTGRSAMMANNSNGRLDKDPVKKALVLEFIKFLNTEEQLQEYTIVSGMARSIDYDLPAADANGDIKITCIDGKTYTFASYYQHLWNLRKSDGSNVVFETSGTESFQKNCASLTLELTKGSLFLNPFGDRPNPYICVSRAGTVDAFDYGSIAESAWNK